jgi:PAS domain-containing protein
LRAILFVHSKPARKWTDTEIKLVEEVAARTWDAVERARAEATLNRRAAELEAILASMPDALYIGDRTGIKRANQLALQQLGFQNFQELADDIGRLGERIQTRDAKSRKRFSPEEEPFARALSGESIVREVAITHLVSGKEVIVRCSARPIWFQGQIIGAVAINTDITAERRAEEALARQALELARSNDDLQQFAHVAAHDLQTPLRMVSTYAQLLQRRYVGQLDTTADEFISTIIGGVDTMRRLTEGPLQLAQAGEETAICPRSALTRSKRYSYSRT